MLPAILDPAVTFMWRHCIEIISSKLMFLLIPIIDIYDSLRNSKSLPRTGAQVSLCQYHLNLLANDGVMYDIYEQRLRIAATIQ